MDISLTLDEIAKATKRASQLTQMMLAYSGYGRFVLVDLSLSELLERMKPELTASLPENINLQLELSDDLPKVTCDEAQMRQMISNIIENSREAIGQKMVVSSCEQVCDIAIENTLTNLSWEMGWRRVVMCSWKSSIMVKVSRMIIY